MKYTLIMSMILPALLLGAYQVLSSNNPQKPSTMGDPAFAKAKTAVFAGGCFWCTEADFEKVDGVLEAVSGYTGGRLVEPTYKAVSAGGTGHVEAVKVFYDPQTIDYPALLEIFWRSIDPTDAGGQFVDRGAQYRSAIFYADEQQRAQAQASKQKLADSGVFDAPIVTEILPLEAFYEAEAYHQNYHEKNPIRYKWYRGGSGRDRFLKQVWAGRPLRPPTTNAAMNDPEPSTAGMDADSFSESDYRKPNDAELRRRLTAMQYKVTQKDATEPPFNNAYWDQHAAGIYVDVVSGEPLFSSLDKFDSGTGWPSFTQPLEPGNIVEKTDNHLFMVRTEVRSKHADSHLGHVFDDGPPPTGLRYCINSAALRFVPRAELEKHGYGRYLKRFAAASPITDD